MGPLSGFDGLFGIHYKRSGPTILVAGLGALEAPCSVRDLEPPSEGSLIRYDGGLAVPSNPVIALIRGDGIGPEVVESAVRVIEAAVRKAYGGSRRIVWWELVAGREAIERCGDPLPRATLEAIRLARAALKGPLETPVGSGYRSLNVAIRQELDLYANIRPVRYYGQPAPHKHADKVNFVIFRENTEDVYAGVEWPHDSPEASRLREVLSDLGVSIRGDAGIGIKLISEFATKRLMRRALEWAIRNENRVVTIMHKGNIMKYTEGAFVKWAYEVALEEFREYVVTEEEVNSMYGGSVPEGKILVNDRIADNMLQQIITRPWDYEVIVAPNLNGDYISDAASALVGGIGMAAGMNLGDGIAVAEPVHGTAPKYAGKNVANPTAEILSASLLIGEFLGWREVSRIVDEAVRSVIREGKVTRDLARYMEGVEPLGTREYADALIEAIESL